MWLPREEPDGLQSAEAVEMGRRRPEETFASDSRAVAPLVGFILLFGLLVVVLAGYQAQVVPQQNADVEFQHFEENRNEMIQLRNAISTAGQSDVSQFPSVRLGTNYQTRTLTVNPPPPVGTLQTSEAYPITIENESGESTTISTRFLEYQPGYNELSVGSTWYENSVLYLDEREQGGNLFIIENQSLVKNNSNRLRITPLQNQYQESGTGRVTIELYPTENFNASDIPDGELTVTLPTRLNKSEYWESQFGEDIEVNEDEYGNGTHKLNLSSLEVDADGLNLNTVGIRDPPEDTSQKQNVGPSGGSNGDSDRINHDNNEIDNNDQTELSIRVDDLTDIRGFEPSFYVSYEVDISHDSVEIDIGSTESGASDSVSGLNPDRGGELLSPSGPSSGIEQYVVTVTAVENGQPVAEESLVTDSDTVNPSENSDLSLTDSPSFDSTTIRDRSRPQPNDVVYRFSWEINTGEFSEVRYFALNTEGNGASDTGTRTAQSQNNLDINVGDGAQNEPLYKVGLLLKDNDGVVVSDVIIQDEADGDGEF